MNLHLYSRSRLPPSVRLTYWLSRHWLLLFSILYGSFVFLPFLAPVFMRIGWTAPANALYFVYSFVCHQLPDRSFYFFGPQRMYSLQDILAVWGNTNDPLVLRQFIGSSDMGWKVAWSDRMVSMYGSILLFAWAWGLLRKRLKHLSIWGLILLALPLAVDGITHLLSDLGGIEQGFRYTNAWLAALTGNAFPEAFYSGNALGSFNSWMRLVTGVMFGAGIVWYGFPYIDEIASGARKQVDLRLIAIHNITESLTHGINENHA